MSHFNDKERFLLVQLVAQEKSIENKQTGAVQLKDKADAWERITKKYASEGFAPRSTKQLKKCWDNMKQRKRKINTSVRHERLMTGGGPAKQTANDPVMDYMDSLNPNLDVELDCPYDSTAAFENELNVDVQELNENTEQILEEPHEETYEARHQPMPSTCTRPVNPSTIENIVDEKVLRAVKLRESIVQQRELHSKKMKIAEVEEKIALTKLLKAEEELRQCYQ